MNWIINTAGENLYGLHSGGWGQIFDGSIFYPYKNVLAYSDMYFLSAAWSYPWSKVLHNPALVSGLVLIVGQIMTMLMSYVWWKKISGNRWAAAIMTTAFGVSQIRLHYQVHLQMWSMQYLLLGLWWIYNWIADKKSWKLYAGTAMLALQVWESLLPVFFGAMVVAVWMWVYKNEFWAERKKLFGAVALGVVIAAAPLAAYWGVAREFNYQRSVRDAAHDGMSVDELWERFASPGIFLVAAAVFLLTVRKKIPWVKSKEVRWLIIVVIVSLVMALGPVLKFDGKTVKFFDTWFVPLPYAAAYYTIPGFGALRTPSRWVWMFAWSLSGVTAIGLARLLSVTKNHYPVKVISLMLFVFLAGTSIKDVRRLPDFYTSPKVYQWISQQPGEVVVELPLVNNDSQTEAMQYLLMSDKKLMNGYSGFFPPERAKWGELLNSNFPNPKAIEELRIADVDWVVINKSKMFIPNAGIYSPDIRYDDQDWMAVMIGQE